METEPRNAQSPDPQPDPMDQDLHPDVQDKVPPAPDEPRGELLREDPSDNSPQEGDQPRGPFERMADDIEAGRITTQVAVTRLFRGLAAQERGDDDAAVLDAFYPGESDTE